MKEIEALEKNPIIDTVYKISVKMRSQAFLVGGLIRDMLLSLPHGNDYDFAISIGKKSISNAARKIAVELKGSAFPLDADEGVYRVVVKNATLPRSFTTNENKSTVKTDLTVDISPLKEGNIEIDLSQRDFTVNAMAVNLNQLFKKNEASLIDPLNGSNDIKSRLIRMSSSHVFRDDPVRLIRAFRLSALYGLQIEEKTKEKIKNNSSRLKDSSWERIRDELFSILETKKACHHIQELSASGVLQQIVSVGINKNSQKVNKFTILTEIENLFDDASAFFGSLEHKLTLYFSEASGGISKLALLKFSALMYDSLELLVSKDRLALAAEHLALVKSIGKRLKLSNKAQQLLINAWQNLSRTSYLLTVSEIKALDCYTLYHESGKDGIFNILMAFGKLKSEDNIDKYGVLRLQMIIAYFFDQYLKLVEDPILSGSDIMDSLGISQGKKVGEIRRMVEQARAEGIISNKEKAIEFIKHKLA